MGWREKEKDMSIEYEKHEEGSESSPESNTILSEATVFEPFLDAAAQKLKGAGSTDRDVSMQRSRTEPTPDQALWVAIRNRCNAISFGRYKEAIDRVFCDNTQFPKRKQGDPEDWDKVSGEELAMLGSPNAGDRYADLAARPSIYGVDAYNLLRLATEIFLLIETGVVKLMNNASTLRESHSDFFPDDTDGKNRYPESLKPLFDAAAESVRFNEKVDLKSVEERLAGYFNGTTNLPYLRRILVALLGSNLKEGLPYCDWVLQHRFSRPAMLELIWSYWHEEGMLAQGMQTIALRFQNRRGAADRDPLANLEIDPLRPLNNLIWGYIQNEHNRLTVPRRAYEYDHHYGLTLYGKAVPRLRSADSRSKFLEGFHNLLNRASVFYRDDSDTTVIADGFPLLNALKDVHLLLAEGAHNQFGDLPWTARVEMLIEQWLLARPEMREFLRGRAMVPYHEPWMGQADSMKKLQGWTDVTITHFHELAVFGEMVLLSIRYGDWIDNANTEDQAKNWARYWKNEIQRYIHAYKAVTGVDLTSDPVDTTPPWMHLRDRLAAQQQRILRA
jgi:hypothetical protein